MTAQQHAALRRANEIRVAQSRIRKALAALPASDGLALAADLITAEPLDSAVASMPVGRLLRHVRGIGHPRSEALLSWAAGTPIKASRRIRQLTRRQRTAIAQALRAKAAA